MEKIHFELPINLALEQNSIKRGSKMVSVEINLINGEHVFTSEPIDIGNYFQFQVFAQISIPYSYDSEMQYITIAGPDETNDKQISIHTYLNQQKETEVKYRLNDMGISSLDHNIWSDFVNKTPSVRDMFNISIKQVIDILVKDLLDRGIKGVIQTGKPPVVTPLNYNDYKNMFLSQKEDVVNPSLEDIIDVQNAVYSTYGGTITWGLNYTFANIIGSTHDPKVPNYYSWIQLWRDACNNGNDPTHCSSYHYSDGNAGFDCGSDFVGGHVIPGTTASAVPKGGTAYIFPICKQHNNNNSIYMNRRDNPTGVVLKNYMQYE